MTQVDVRPTDALAPEQDDKHSVVGAIAVQLGIRVIELVGFLVLLVTVLFFLARLQGDPAVTLAGPEASVEDVARIRVIYGLDSSLIIQYLNFLKHFVLFDFGDSINERTSAIGLAAGRLKTTLTLCVIATIINVAVATPIGIYIGAGSAGRRRPLRKIVSGTVLASQGIQYYVVALLLITVFAIKLQLLPSIGFDQADSWILPSLSLAWLAAPRLARVVQSAASQVWSSEVVHTATAYGLSPATIRNKYVLPNVMVPLIATAGTQFTLLLSGAVIVEQIFGINGLGQLLVVSVQNADFPSLAAGVTLIGLIVFAVTAISDVLYRIVDPRLRRNG
jgi:ABC-type dipeptide/oligopeptide/nickel transport system permease component